MEKEPASPNCEKCLRPIAEAGSKATTQWRSFCKCDRAYAPNNQFYIPVCNNCKRRVAGSSANNADKMNMLFLCSCSSPSPKKVPNFQKLARNDEPVVLEVETVGIAADAFPSERYTPIAVLGQNTRDDAILARDRQTGNKVAIKLFKGVAPESFAAFEQDTKKSKKLSHNNIARLLDAGIYNGKTPYTVTDYKDAFDLEQNLAINGRPSHDVVIKIMTTLCETSIYGQKEGLLHRQYKPGDVLFVDDLNAEPTVVVTDFCLPNFRAKQKWQDRSDVLFLSGDEARNLDYDERSETYVIGCIGFMLLTGQAPFIEGSPQDIKNAHALKLPPKFSAFEFDPARPKELEDIVYRCLEKDPRVRFDTVAQLLERLEVFPRREKMHVAAIEAAKKRKKLLVMGAAGVGAMIVCGIAFALFGAH